MAFNAARVVSNRLFGLAITDRSPLAHGLYKMAQALNHVFHPGHRRWRRFMAENPMCPWWVPEAVLWLEKNIRPGMRAFEWGAGRSTVWFANHGIEITCVETHHKWASFVTDLAPAAHVILTDAKDSAYASFIDHGAPYDLIEVDGYYRAHCFPKALASIKPGGIIIVDNADDAYNAPIVEPWAHRLLASFDNGLDRTNFYRG
jgi:hypothetical protein